MNRRARERGATLIDAVVGVALMSIVFVGIVGAFRLAVQAVGNNSARAGAIALANERLEYVRSLAYDAIGTVGGIPSGALEQEETLILNNTDYTRRTFVSYEDDPGDGVAPTDTIPTDYRAIKTSVSWESRQGTRTITMVARISPPGVEQAVPGGILAIRVTNDADAPIENAAVTIVNDTTSPSIDTTTYTDVNGYAMMLGAPPAANYEISVTKSGYSTSKTYSADAENTNPVPAHLSVALNQTTAANFEIDVLSSLAVHTFAPIEEETWDDTFSNASKLGTLDDVEVIGGELVLISEEGAYVTDGAGVSISVSPDYLYSWDEVSWEDVRPVGTDIRYHVYTDSGVLVPDADLSGNTAGFSSGPVSLANLATTTYPALRIGAELTSNDPNETPRVESWNIAYGVGPTPIPDIAFDMRGVKTIGAGPSGLIYKLDETYYTNDDGEVDILGLEYDVYTILVPASTGYDVSSSCTPQPTIVTPGASASAQLFLSDHTTNSLLVDVRAANGTLMTGVDVRLQRGTYDETVQTDACGNAFFPGIAASDGTQYVLTVLSATENVDVAGTTRFSVLLSE